jgi:DNA mismatch endonuclease (patch repair protein)
MKHQRRRDTRPELAIRSALHQAGLRFRVDYPLPGLRRRGDIVFRRRRLVVFVDGCFWHCCPEHGTWPRENAEWWRAKLEANVERDRDTDARLADSGWLVLRVWEHEEPFEAASRIAATATARLGE